MGSMKMQNELNKQYDLKGGNYNSTNGFAKALAKEEDKKPHKVAVSDVNLTNSAVKFIKAVNTPDKSEESSMSPK